MFKGRLSDGPLNARCSDSTFFWRGCEDLLPAKVFSYYSGLTVSSSNDLRRLCVTIISLEMRALPPPNLRAIDFRWNPVV